MGRDSLQYYLKRMTRPLLPSSSACTDLWNRLTDPVPEVARYLNPAN